MTLMVSSFLKICPMVPTISYAFAEILRYYGEVFLPEHMIIDKGEIIRLEGADMTKTADILVIDPFRPGVNAALTLTRFSEIKELFSDRHRYLIEKAMSSSKEKYIEGDILNGFYAEIAEDIE